MADINEINRHEVGQEIDPEMSDMDVDNNPTMNYEVVEVQSIDIEPDTRVEGVPSSVLDEPGYWLPGPDQYKFQMFVPEENVSPMNPNVPGLRYDKKQCVWVEDYPVPTAGMAIREATREEMKKYVWGEPGDIGELADPDNFEIAEFLLKSKISGKERENFLKLNKFTNQMPWESDYLMMKDVDKLPRRKGWKPKHYEVGGSLFAPIETAWFRNSAEVFKELFGILKLKDEYQFRPERHYTSRNPSEGNRRYGEQWAGDAMWKLQQKLKDRYGTLGRYIIATDQTPLTGFCGNKKAHPVYFSIANLPKAIRRTHSHRAMVLIGYLPVPDLTCEPNADKARELRTKLFNDCMCDLLQPLTDAERVGIEVVCTDGGVRRVYPTLVSAIADFPEQCKNACIKGSFCPVCLVKPENRGDLDQNVPLHERGPTLEAIIEHRREGSAIFEDFGLNNQWPWWNRNQYINIATMHTPDLLHQCHKGVFKDHIAKWLAKIIGTRTLDSRYQAMSRHHGIRHFKRGVSKLSRSTGREAKEMMKAFLPAASGGSPQVVTAIHALLKFMYLAHSSTLTEAELCEMDRQLKIFHDNKAAFDEAGCLKKGFYNIPKFHSLQHYTHMIRMLGTPDSYNTEAPERLHIDLTKAGFKASNKVDGTELEQMTKYIQRMDSLAVHRAYLTYKAQPESDIDDERADLGNMDGPAGEDEIGQEADGEDMEYVKTDSNKEQRDSIDGEADEVDEAEDAIDDDLSAGCVVERLVGAETEVQSQGQGSSTGRQEPQLYYPNPAIVTAATHKTPFTVQKLVIDHLALNIVRDISLFLKGIHPVVPQIMLSPSTELHIWTVARLFHAPLPFKPLDPPKIDHIRAKPPTTDEVQRIRRVGQFDTVLVLAYPNKTGIHRYRAARVRVIFELPSQYKHLYPHKLVYVEWFNPFSTTPTKYWEAYTTSKSFDQSQRARTAVIPLSSIQLTCHLGPRFTTIDEEVQLTPFTDIFAVCRSFIFNQFSSYFTFDLLEHWSNSTPSYP